MKLRTLLIGILIVVIIALAVFAYWYFMLGPTTSVPIQPANNGGTGAGGFQPLNTTTSSSTPNKGGAVLSPGGTTKPVTTNTKPPALRLLSNTPVGGYSASSTTATSTTIRWVDRGRGNVYQTMDNTIQVTTLSNTVVPKIFNAIWNKNLDSFVGAATNGTRISAVAPVKIAKTSVLRHRIRRRIYEAVRPFVSTLTPGHIVIFFAKQPAVTTELADLRSAVQDVFVKAGLLR